MYMFNCDSTFLYCNHKLSTIHPSPSIFSNTSLHHVHVILIILSQKTMNILHVHVHVHIHVHVHFVDLKLILNTSGMVLK